MPPKAAPKKPPASKALVSKGAREVFSNAATKSKEPGKKQERETTTRALVLRNGKYGARGTGELMLMTRMSGREKMDLLAEDLLEKSKVAIMTPFRLESCLKIGESQCDAYLDDIANLRDADLFYRVIDAELQARTEPSRTEPRKNPSHVAKLVATRVHNTYMLASAWKLVSETLGDLAIDGLTDKNVKLKLGKDKDMRERYMVLHDMVNVLVDMNQDRFSLLATTTEHYARFFKLKPTESTDPGEAEYIFDWTDLRKAADSFIDSIIIELCFPRGIYPKAILYQLLHDAVTEAPKEAKRFPQALWDAVGDLSESVQLQELLAAPLFGAEGAAWKNEPREMPEEYEQWLDAQIFSRKATDMFASFKDIIFPLEKTRKQPTLDNMWKQINANYQSVSGRDIDALWGLTDVMEHAPQWTSFFIPTAGGGSDDDGPPGLALTKRKKAGTKERLRLTAGGGNDTDDSMPGLQSVSNTSDDDDEDDDDDDENSDEDDEDESDDESGYNTEEEDDIRDMLREAMDVAHEADFLDSGANVPPELDPFKQEDRKGNPFIKLLGSLRGRMFSANPKLKATTKTEPRTAPLRGAFRATPSGTPKSVPSTIPPKPAPGSAPTATPQAPPKSMKATVEDAEDDDDDSIASAKKKKKKKPKKKKKASSPELPPSSPTPSMQSLDSLASTTLGNNMSPKKTTPVAAQPTSPKPASARPAVASSLASSFASSTATLPIGETVAQSGHAYLKSENVQLDSKKVKSRPDHASLFSNADDKKEQKSGFFSRFGMPKGKDKDKPEIQKEAKASWFSKLGKKTNTLMHQLLKTSGGEARASMKWEDFLKLMREMGFDYDPSTAGSSVRFDPPNKSDRSITFHKPHPDPTLQPHHLNEFAKKLKRYYGWNEEDLLRL